MANPNDPPPGNCRQCWKHAYDKSIHRALKPGEDCKPCVDHMGGHPPEMIVPGKRTWGWW
jgi:hypothetical protein